MHSVPAEENRMLYQISYAQILELIELEDSNMILRNEAVSQVGGNGDGFLKILQECSEKVSQMSSDQPFNDYLSEALNRCEEFREREVSK